MSNAFVNPINQKANEARTYNGALTHKSSTDANVDFFFVVGNRNKDFTNQFDAAYAKDRELALRTVLWARDIRGGAGERETVYKILRHIESNYPQELAPIVNALPTFGRWDDLLAFTGAGRGLAIDAFVNALKNENKLAAKWMPREKSSDKNKVRFFHQVRKEFDMTPRNFRKFIARLTEVVETKMCAKKFNEINYSHVPSVASARYQKAFGRNDRERYGAYLAGLKTGETKINAAAIYPYDIIRGLRVGNVQAAEAQWSALPDYMDDSSVLPMVDVSGSMLWYPVGQASKGSRYYTSPSDGRDGKVYPMDVAISLGIYAADKAKGAFKGVVLSFDSDPKLISFANKRTLKEKVQAIRSAGIGTSTNLERAFGHILKHAIDNNVPESDMPKTLLILSDMEFNRAIPVSQYNYAKAAYETAREDTLYQRAQKAYRQAGYQLPRVVFWNLNSRAEGGNSPVKADENGTALVSGFSPAIMKGILSNDMEAFTPFNVMLKTLMDNRYDIWKTN